MKNSIIEYFNSLSITLTTSPFEIIERSKKAKFCCNKRRHLNQLIKQPQHYLTRFIDCSWPIKPIKKYLNDLKSKFAKRYSIYRNTLRIQFSNPGDVQIVIVMLSRNAFLQHVQSLTFSMSTASFLFCLNTIYTF